MIVSKSGAIWNIRIEKNLSDKFATCVTASALTPVPLLSYSPKREKSSQKFYLRSRIIWPVFHRPQKESSHQINNSCYSHHKYPVHTRRTWYTCTIFWYGKHTKTKFAKPSSAWKSFRKILYALFNCVKHKYKCLGIPWWQEKLNYCGTAERTLGVLWCIRR